MNSVKTGKRKIYPSKIICIGLNYVEHIAELDNKMPEEMVVFLKPNSAVSDSVLAVRGEPIHYEGELSFIVEDNHLAYVAFGLDLTKRETQYRLKKNGHPWDRAKAFDGAAVFSEFVEIQKDKIGDLYIELIINDKIVQSGNTNLMIYKPLEILSAVSQFMTLNNGDIIMTGTPKGVGPLQSNDQLIGMVKLDGEPLVQNKWVVE